MLVYRCALYPYVSFCAKERFADISVTVFSLVAMSGISLCPSQIAKTDWDFKTE